MNTDNRRKFFAFIASIVVGFIWFSITCLVAMEGIETSEQHLPFWQKLGDAIVMFPMNCLVDLNKNPTGLSGHASDEYFLTLSVLNSLFWGFGLVALYHRVARLFIAKSAGKPGKPGPLPHASP
jgi:hypothetical protein